MKLRSALLAATVLVAPVAAKAQAVNGLYVGAGVGVNFLQNEHVDSIAYPSGTGFGYPVGITTPNRPNGGGLHVDTGWMGTASIGYGLGNGLRLELEGSYRNNKLSSITNLPNIFKGGGDEKKYTGMFNVLYDIDPAIFGMGSFPVIPYVGVGVGYSWAQDRNARFYRTAAPSILLRSNDSDGSIAVQAILGASFPIAAVPGLSLTADYRFMALPQDRTYNYQYFSPVASTRVRMQQSENYNHAITVGVRYAFNAAPPPVAAPMAAPVAPTAARTYMVFFDWDRADLTTRAKQIIAEAAQATTRVQVTRIEVNGYTDTSGTARYNQGLSVRRADAVAAELVRNGVPRTAITTQGFGETRPLVATGPGVREAQNRRVEIILR